MNTMIERVARVLEKRLYPHMNDESGECLEMARAMIEEMRRPSEAMYEATDHICERTGDETEIYVAFIDAALTEP